jgi:hypothetical protein
MRCCLATLLLLVFSLVAYDTEDPAARISTDDSIDPLVLLMDSPKND